MRSRARGLPLRRVPPRRLRAAIDATLLTASDTPRSLEAGAIAWMRAPGWLGGQRVYAVGDVHGCAEQLAELHGRIEADMARRPIAAALLIHLGDYIDLGAHSASVLDRLVRGSPAGLRTINFAGDHEQMLLDALDGDRAAGTDWLEAGGASTLQSWGLDPDTPRERWAALIPPAHLAFLRSLITRHKAGSYVFVHAGMRPGVPIARQARDDLQRIRQPFLSSQRDFGCVVVHGHSSSVDPVVTPNRIGIDTGAGIGGKLTCAVLEEDRLGFLQA